MQNTPFFLPLRVFFPGTTIPERLVQPHCDEEALTLRPFSQYLYGSAYKCILARAQIQEPSACIRNSTIKVTRYAWLLFDYDTFYATPAVEKKEYLRFNNYIIRQYAVYQLDWRDSMWKVSLWSFTEADRAFNGPRALEEAIAQKDNLCVRELLFYGVAPPPRFDLDSLDATIRTAAQRQCLF